MMCCVRNTPRLLLALGPLNVETEQTTRPGQERRKLTVSASDPLLSTGQTINQLPPSVAHLMTLTNQDSPRMSSQPDVENNMVYSQYSCHFVTHLPRCCHFSCTRVRFLLAQQQSLMSALVCHIYLN